MYVKLGENMASRYFALQKVLLTLRLVIFAKKYQTLVEINVLVNLKVGQQW